MTLKTKSQKPESGDHERLVGGRKFLNMTPIRKVGGAMSGGKKHSSESGSSLSGMY